MSEHAQNHALAKFVLIEKNSLPSLTLSIFMVNASKKLEKLYVRHLCDKYVGTFTELYVPHFYAKQIQKFAEH